MQVTIKLINISEIMIVDDDIFNHEAIDMILLSLNIEIKIERAYRGDTAIQKYKEKLKNKCGKLCEVFKFILMDIDMPVMDGIEAS